MIQEVLGRIHPKLGDINYWPTVLLTGGLISAAWGYLLCAAGSQSLLFDTGQSQLLRANAQALGAPLQKATAVVLSHGHYDHTGGRFSLDEQRSLPDPLTDDQALFFEAKEGIIAILGCAHAGVVNTLRHVRETTGGKSIHTVLGGMHLLNAKPERIEKTLEAFQQLGVQRLGPAHCTSTAATARLWEAFPGRCFGCSVGTRLKFAGL